MLANLDFYFLFCSFFDAQNDNINKKNYILILGERERERKRERVK
jgi:hypothetical protein